jgi:ribosomal protein S18 acetylase RimI-like enzyme
MIYPSKKIILKNQRDVTLRSPLDRDAQEILDYLNQVTGETPFLLRTPEECVETVQSEVLFIQNINQHPTQVMILAIIDQEIIGICNVGLKTRLKVKHRATLGISVKKHYWGLGIGSILMDEMIEIAKHMGAERLELEVIEGNERAIKLYQKKGFQVMSEIKGAIKDSSGTYRSEIVMTLDLLSRT